MTAKPFGKRRDLRFADLTAVPAEVRRLVHGYRTSGNWTLAQICRHLADTINGSMDGLELRRHRIKRWFFAGPLLAYTYRYGIPRGYTVDPALTPPDGVRLEESLAALDDAVLRYRSFQGRLRPHPLFGRLTRAGWDQLHCFHCAHHLSFVEPTPPSEPACERR